MGPSEATAAVEKGARLAAEGPAAFAAAVFALAFVCMLVVFIRQTSARAQDAKETRDVAVKLSVATHAALEVVARLEERDARTERRPRRAPRSNPGLRPEDT